MLFDTHCHLNFKVFEKNLSQVIADAKNAGVSNFIVPGTDYESSKRAVEIAEKYEGIYTAVGIHPHHIYEMYQDARYHVSRPPHPPAGGTQAIDSKQVSSLLPLLSSKKVVAIGEVGLDRHYYQKTKYQNYQINEEFIKLQKLFFLEQIKLADTYKKSLIIHNRESKEDLLDILNSHYSFLSTMPIVFHCCEADEDLLNFASKHNIYIGVDGDVTYDKKKQEFVKKIPRELLVLETDSPFLFPRSPSLRPGNSGRANEPKNLLLIAEFIARLTGTTINQLIEVTTENSKKLFQI